MSAWFSCPDHRVKPKVLSLMTWQISLISFDEACVPVCAAAETQEALIYRNCIPGETFNLLFWKNQPELDVCSCFGLGVRRISVIMQKVRSSNLSVNVTEDTCGARKD